jgi:hypothetical protein
MADDPDFPLGTMTIASDWPPTVVSPRLAIAFAAKNKAAKDGVSVEGFAPFSLAQLY